MARTGSSSSSLTVNPAISAEVQRALRALEQKVNALQSKLSSLETQVGGKLGSSPDDLKAASKTIRDELQANGSAPLSITKLSGVAAQPQIAAVSSNVPTVQFQEGMLVQQNGKIYVVQGGQLVPAIASGNLTEATSAVLAITGGVGAVLGAGTNIRVKQSTALQDGYLSASDWASFNGKQNALSYTPLNPANNLSDVASVVTSRSNLGLGSAATQPTTAFDAAGAAAAAVAAIPTANTSTRGLLSAADWNTFNGKQTALGYTPLNPANNLSELTATAATARTNLGLATVASSGSYADLTGKPTIPAAQVAANLANSTSTGVTGTLPIGNGGTGQTTQQAAINALTGTQSAAKYLRSDGTNATLSSIQASDVPTLNQNTTGTAANVTGTVGIANGGTGQTTAAAALTALGAPGLATANTFAANQTIALPSAANGSAAIPFKLNIGADATLGALDLWMLVFPSATPSARWAGFSVGDAGAMRPLVLNTNGTIFGRVLTGSTTDNGVDALQVTGSMIASTQVKTGGLVTGIRSVSGADTATTSDHTIISTITLAATETLPAAPLTGQEFYLENVGSATWTISGNGKNIWSSGASAASITLAANASAILQYDGTLWRRIV